MAEQYSRMLSKRMTDVRLHETRAGRWVGGVPCGYDRVDGFLVANERIAAARLAGELYRTGRYGAGYIAKALNDAGHTRPDGSSFKTTGVEELLKSPAYAGYVVCGDLVLPGKHEAVWSQAEWARIQEVAAARGHRRTNYNAPFHPLLAGLIVCGGCGAPMWHQPNGKFRYYRCSACINRIEGPVPGLRCEGTYVRAPNIEALVLAWIGGLALSPELMADARRLLNTRVERHVAPPIDVEAKLKRLARAYADGAYSDVEYETKRAALLAIQEPPPEVPRQDDDGRALLALIANLPTLLTETTNEHRQAILRELVTEVYGRKDALLALRPTRLAEALFQAAAERTDWQERAKAVLTDCTAGGPGGDRTHDTRLKRPLLYR
jgi:hypothetical protein